MIIQLQKERATTPDHINVAYERVALKIDSLYAEPANPFNRYPNNPAYPYSGHAVFGLIQNRFRWGQNPIWDAISTVVQPDEIRHRYDLPYQPSNNASDRHWGQYWGSDELGGDGEDGEWDPDNEFHEDEDW